ncbi:MAG TPA: helix-turn-helix domain-containing protein [Anaeromyxobacteraceae bacterium]|nr:helix-turn-helix domain-containing protein [Anaeromyxobacteraceae bacterium]
MTTDGDRQDARADVMDVLQRLEAAVGGLSRSELPAAIGAIGACEVRLFATYIAHEVSRLQAPPKALDLLLTAKQVSERLGVSVDQVHEFIRRSEIPGVRVGRLVRVRASKLEKWIDQQEASPVPHRRYRPRGRR